MKCFSLRSAALTALLLGTSLATQASLVTLTSYGTHHAVARGDSSVDNDLFTNTGFPLTDSATATADGGNTATTNINWTNTITSSVLNLDVSHTRSGTSGGFSEYALSQLNQVQFSVSTDVNYNLSGSYSSTFSNAASRGRTVLSVILRNAANQIIFESTQYDYQASSGNSFTLGGNGGNFQTILTGSTNGSLTAGNYSLYYLSYIQNDNGSDTGGTASGDFSFTLTDANAVPLPGPLTMMMLGLAGFVGIRHRNHRR